MRVMTNHEWFDEDIEYVDFGFESGCHKEVREIGLKKTTDAFLINKADVVALAKEFGLVVYEHDANL